ncbi:MAG: PRC-barrel domain-containing protein [Thermoleophilaceae bacterium]
MATLENVSEWRGREMFDRHGDKIGKIDSIYVDQGSGRAEWALVNTGLFGMRSTWVPISEAVSEPHGVRVPVEKATVKGAPSMDPNSEMSRDEEVELFRYYGLSYEDHGADTHGHATEAQRHDHHDERVPEHQRDERDAGQGVGHGHDQDVHHDERSPEVRRTEPGASLDDRPPDSRERYREDERQRSQEPETLAGQPAAQQDEQPPTHVHRDAPGHHEAPVHQEAPVDHEAPPAHHEAPHDRHEAPVHQQAPPVHQEAPVHQERSTAYAGEPAPDSRAGRGVPYADWGLDEPQPPASEAPVEHAARPPERGHPEQDVAVEHRRPESHERQPDDQRAHGHESDAYREQEAFYGEQPGEHREQPVDQHEPLAGEGAAYGERPPEQHQGPAPEAADHGERPSEHDLTERGAAREDRPAAPPDPHRVDPAPPRDEGHRDAPASRPEPGAGAEPDQGTQGSGRHPRLERGVDRVATRLKRLI